MENDPDDIDETDDFDDTDDTDDFDGIPDLDDAVQRFLANADDVYAEYEEGYMHADAALDLLSDHIETLREAQD